MSDDVLMCVIWAVALVIVAGSIASVALITCLFGDASRAFKESLNSLAFAVSQAIQKK